MQQQTPTRCSTERLKTRHLSEQIYEFTYLRLSHQHILFLNYILCVCLGADSWQSSENTIQLLEQILKPPKQILNTALINETDNRHIQSQSRAKKFLINKQEAIGQHIQEQVAVPTNQLITTWMHLSFQESATCVLQPLAHLPAKMNSNSQES